MSGTPESGHAKNVVAFENLINFCSSYGIGYNPPKDSLKLSALESLLAEVNASLKEHKVAKANFDNAASVRKLAFHPLKKLAAMVVTALAASGAPQEKVNDTKAINKRLRGKKSKAIMQPLIVVEGGPASEPVRTVSVSQQIFDTLIEYFEQLIEAVAAEPLYLPSEDNLKVAALKALLNDLRTKNTEVINTFAVSSSARIVRDKVMYAHDVGMVDTSAAVKVYVRAVFGGSSPEYKQLIRLRFTYRSGV